MFTWLRRIASCIFLTLAILFAALWVRSYLVHEQVPIQTASGIKGGYLAYSGRLVIEAHVPATDRLGRTYLEGWVFQLPIWSLVFSSTFLALTIRPAPRFKFSLRDLFTLTTVAALTIGLLAFCLRSIG